MPRRIDQLPADATSLARRLAALEREVRELRASKRASWATIGGGDTTITGATIETAESGQRVVLADGALSTYDDDDHQTNYVGGSDNVVWNQSGWDPDGTPAGEWVGMSDGNFVLGTGDAASLDDRGRAGLLGVLGVGFGAVLQSPGDAFGSGGYENPAFLLPLAGKAGGQTGTVNAPQAQVQGDVGVTGALVKLTSTFDTPSWRNVPEVWHAPTPNTNWASGSNASGNYGSMQYRQDAEDNVHICGTVHCTLAAGLAAGSYTLFTLPVGWRPKKIWPTVGAHVSGADAWKTAVRVNVDLSGSVNFNTPVAITQNDGIYFNVTVPLGNIA